MIINYSELINLPIGSLSERKKIGEIQDFVIDKENLLVLGILVKTSNSFFSKPKAILSMDILDIDKNGVTAKSEECLLNPKENIKIKIVLDNREKIIGLAAYIKDGDKIGKIIDYEYTTAKGVKIDGRVYYPPDFNPEKKYPMIVYYYSGTFPTIRDFGGRYPKHYWAANGYIVYVLQPSGAVGYGQDFSSAHVNNWGITVADEIIESVKSFVATNKFVDPKKVGCIGASYGGFMTMLLLTKTNIFSAAISHAGISSIASYWGEGYWGYSYSAVASENSFPWNNRDLYVNQSPLFNADNIHTPLLLLHGTNDKNVPTGESIQLYTALKILGRPVELIEVEGEDHHITDVKKRLIWSKTIVAWFDKYLKDQNDWWNYLYPETNY